MKRLLLPALLIVLGSCSAPREKIPDTMPTAPVSSSKPVIYQMMTRLFGNTKSDNIKYGTIEQNGVGKFNDINDAALDGIKSLGVTHVWYTGVLEHASLTDYSAAGIPLDDPDVVKGRAGSPYAIKDYYDVDPDLATDVAKRMAEFTALVDRTHAHGMKAIIDFIPNHVARSYHSDAKPAGVKDLGEGDDTSVAFKADNNFYYLPGTKFQPPAQHNPLGRSINATGEDRKFSEEPAKATGNDVFSPTPNVNDWFETVKLNYGIDIQNGRKTYFEPVPGTWQKMLDILLFWAEKNVDGFRCDMAEMVPVEFWGWAIPQVKAIRPDIIFIAEIYNPAVYRDYIEKGHFDYLYDKVQLYDTLRLIINGKASSTSVPQIQQSLNGINQYMLHFLENHDEQRIASTFFAGDAWKAIPAMVVSATIDRGPIMIYFGQEVGEPGMDDEGFSSSDGRTTMFDYWGVKEHQKWVNGAKYDGGALEPWQKQLRQFYGDILSLSTEREALSQGDYADLTEFNVRAGNIPDGYVAFARFTQNEKIIVLAGTTKASRAKIVVPADVVSKMNVGAGASFVGRDLLRSGAEIGLNATASGELVFEVDVPASSAFVFKLK